jgi:hypothetical protein
LSCRPAAVLVDRVAGDLGRAEPDGAVGVVAVAVSGDPVAVRVDDRRRAERLGDAVAVLVDVVAGDLGGTRPDRPSASLQSSETGMPSAASPSGTSSVRTGNFKASQI